MKHRIVMLSGDEHELRRRALQDLLQAAGDADDDFDREEFDGGSSSPIEWLGSAGTAPFLASRRTAIVRHLLRVDPTEVKLEGLPESALLVLIADDESGDDFRQQRLKGLRSSWERLVVKSGGLAETFEAESREVKKSIRGEAEARGKKLPETSADILVEMTGNSFSRALEELDKLVLYVGDQPVIREADVRAAVVPSREWNVFRLVDSLLSGQAGAALQQLRILVGSQNKAEDAALRNILPQMSRNLRLVWQARLLLDEKAQLNQVPPRVIAMLPERNNILKEKPFVQSKAMNLARRVSLAKLSRCLSIVAQTDARLKGTLGSYSPMDSLERMALEIAQAVR